MSPHTERHDADATRLRLIEAGLELFGMYGFDATSTRMLAEHAEVNIAAIQYHFGSKEGLYHAVATHMMDKIDTFTDEVFVDIDNHLADPNVSPATAHRLLELLVERLTEMFVGSDEAEKLTAMAIREELNPTQAQETMYKRFMSRFHIAASRLIGIAGGRAADDPENTIEAHALFGQVVIFTTGRISAYRSLGIDRLSKEHTALIRTVLRRHVAAVVGPTQEKKQ